MALYAIGDTHLAIGKDKPMDIFGPLWDNHTEKLRAGFAKLNDDDVCVICGDISWGMGLEDTLEDFLFIDSLPGRKIILKGNHDYWWTTAAKMTAFFAANGLDRVHLLHNNCMLWEDTALCGTRGWFFEEETGSEHDEKILRREVGRLKTSLDAAGEAEKLVFLHYPPLYQFYQCPDILDLLRSYGVKECCYGHIHGKGAHAAFIGERDGVKYRLVSADFLDFFPYKVR